MPELTATLSGRHTRPDGAPHAGTVLVVPDAPVVRDLEGGTVYSGAWHVPLDELGAYSIPVRAYGTADPAHLTYSVQVRLADGAWLEPVRGIIAMPGATVDVTSWTTPAPADAVPNVQRELEAIRDDATLLLERARLELDAALVDAQGAVVQAGADAAAADVSKLEAAQSALDAEAAADLARQHRNAAASSATTADARATAAAGSAATAAGAVATHVANANPHPAYARSVDVAATARTAGIISVRTDFDTLRAAGLWLVAWTALPDDAAAAADHAPHRVPGYLEVQMYGSGNVLQTYTGTSLLSAAVVHGTTWKRYWGGSSWSAWKRIDPTPETEQAGKDTGWRRVYLSDATGAAVVGSLPAGWAPRPGLTGSIRVRRIGAHVHVAIEHVLCTVNSTTDRLWVASPGFAPDPVVANLPTMLQFFNSNSASKLFALTNILARGAILPLNAGDFIYAAQITYPTNDAWPTTLPGIPA